MKNLLALFGRNHTPDGDALSALLDGQLAPDEAATLRSHAAACIACTARIDELTALRGVLRSMPLAEAPRSFRLRQADVEARPRVTATGGTGAGVVFGRLMPALSGVAAAVFVLLIVLDNGGSGSRTDGNVTALSAEKSADSPAASRAESGDAFQYDEDDGSGGASGNSGEDRSATGLQATAETVAGAMDPVAGEPPAGVGAVAPEDTASEGALPDAPAPQADASQPETAPTSANDLEAASRATAPDDDDGDGTRTAQVVLAAVALGAAAVAIGWRIRRRV